MKLAFIGAGKMATAIAGGLVENDVLPADSMAAADISAEARSAFTSLTGVTCADSASEIVGAADVVLLAVKPQVAAQAVEPIAGQCRDQLIVSIAAGIPLSTLCNWFGSERVIRVMPNTPLMVGKGATVFTCADQVGEADREFARTIFGALGVVLEMSEDKMDAVTALSGSGPAYVFELIQALVDAAVAVGLPADAALQLTAQTVAGAAEMVQRGMGTADELRLAVTSPGGTTQAGLAVLSAARFRSLVGDVVRAARDRSIELGRG